MVVFHAIVRILIRSPKLNRVSELGKGVFQFPHGRKEKFSNDFIDPQFNIPLVYLTDTFKKVDDVNLRL